MSLFDKTKIICLFFCYLLFVFNFKTKSKIQERQLSSDAELFTCYLKFIFCYFSIRMVFYRSFYHMKFHRIVTTDFLQILKNHRKKQILTGQLTCYADFSFMIILHSCFLKSHYCNIIFNLLILLSYT